ncbi:CRISPR-associated endoribonuclease Cas2 [Methanimicrococcus sp. At1]|uniref:CRISPR-associated endoribonuclease Cas2 n=1 Tax=Methanimicrococcus hacksteinii TaxID=3028293 RepID=A0ABU3VQ59_9EURY|nr:CRISPR-associated endonuclease Cas2 [Methanimicrococcus sp. At1]MDV0445552.1 CRISPR-associated endoribonuclease Cas2 [Methanimicrococcus sp. At1]
MLMLITYDVNTETSEGKKRLRKIAKECQNYGQRVQNSVFECLIDPTQFAKLKYKLESIMDLQTDSIRYYNLGSNWQNRVEHIGAKESYNPEGFLFV